VLIDHRTLRQRDRLPYYATNPALAAVAPNGVAATNA
jgi:hypothetical protein